MSKRFQPMKEFGRSMKKPKLDISINSRNATDAVCSISTAQQKQPLIGRNVSPIKSNPSSFWDDDDDDVILLATQKAEAAVAAKQHYNDNTNITESDITFSEFANAATTSTQRPVACVEISGPDILSQMLNDDDEDLELLAAVEKTDPGIFKKPASLPPCTHLQSLQTQKQNNQISVQTNTLRVESSEAVEFVLSQNTCPESTLPPTQSAARRQLASERQIKFLMEKVDVLKKENSKLSKDLTEAKTNVASKEGEASLLRDELRHLKQQAQTLRVEKILNAKNVKNECQSKINEMTKVVEGKEAQVKLKAMECSLVKMRLDTTQRLQQSIIGSDVSIRKLHTKEKGTKTPTEIIQSRIAKSIIKMPSFNICSSLISQRKKCSLSQIHPLIYEHSLDKGSSKKQRTLLQVELESIQTKLAQLQLLGPEKLPEDFLKRCIDSVCRVLPEFWSYTHSLEFPKNRRIHPYHEYSLVSTKTRESFESICCLQEPTELYDDERCLCLRRYIAALAIICKQVPVLSNAIMEHKHSNYYILQIATDSVIKLSFAREICEHFGVLEALAVWLNSLLIHVSVATTNNCVEMLLDLMKSLVFARPSAWIFREISIGLMECCRLPNALETLCINSPESTFVSDRVRSTYRFTNESCFLQVYCGLLEIAFPLSTRFHVEHLKLLAVICLNHIRLVYHCFQKPPKFIQKLLPLYDDDEDGGGGSASTNTRRNQDRTNTTCNNNKIVFNKSEQIYSLSSSVQNNVDNSAKPSNQRCECYVKLCLSVVTLIFQLLRQWLLHKKEFCTPHIAEISRLSVQLLHIIFCDNYLSSLFRESEETTKHYLCLIIKWWSDNTKQLQFNEINLKFLHKLQSSHILPRDIIAETNNQNIMVDLNEWQKYTNDKMNQSKPPIDMEEAEKCVSKLNLLENASNQNKFFESLKGYAFNFQ